MQNVGTIQAYRKYTHAWHICTNTSTSTYVETTPEFEFQIQCNCHNAFLRFPSLAVSLSLSISLFCSLYRLFEIVYNIHLNNICHDFYFPSSWMGCYEPNKRYLGYCTRVFKSLNLNPFHSQRNWWKADTEQSEKFGKRSYVRSVFTFHARKHTETTAQQQQQQQQFKQYNQHHIYTHSRIFYA